MPRLANERHELYALHRAKGFNSAKAGLAAGYASGSSTAATLEADPDVHVRIGEIMQELETRKLAAREAAIEAAKTVGQLTGVTKSWVIQKLSENAQLAANDGAYKESNEALKLIGDEFGMFKGDSAQDNDKAQIKPFDLSKLENAFDGPGGARNITPPAVKDVPPPQLTEGADRVMDELKAPAGADATQDIPADVMRLIQGQGKNSAQERAKARRLATGSETDVASRPESEPDLDDEMVWVDVKGKTPEEIMRLAKGGKPAPAEAEDEDDADDEPPLEIDEPVFEDDTPPRRSQRGRL